MAKAKSKQETKKLTTPKPLVLKPGDEGYDAEKDPVVVGYVPGNSSWKEDEKTPYDYITDPKTGLRPGETKKPWGASSTDLSEGIASYHCLPSINVWRGGKYLSDVYWEPKFKAEELPTALQTKLSQLDWQGAGNACPPEIFNYYIVSGEGTPGNNYYRIYLLPKEIAKETTPKHPLMWPDSLKKGKTTSGSSGYTGYAGGGYASGAGQGQTKTTTTKSLPAGVRIRCTGCGHWFKMNDLSGHAQVCGEDADWAMMCDPQCGCETLDQASKPKPGFPRKPKAEETDETKTDKPSPQPAVAP